MTRRPQRATSIHQVREMFSALSLPLCDDGPSIQAAADKQRSARNRELNSTKGTVAARAQNWFEQVDALLKKRAQLLDAAYQDFVGLGDAVLAAAGFGAKRKIAKGGRTALLQLAQDWCGAREDLARHWVDKFISERKLGSPPVGVGSRTTGRAPSQTPPSRSAASGKGSPRTGGSQLSGARKLTSPAAMPSPSSVNAAQNTSRAADQTSRRGQPGTQGDRGEAPPGRRGRAVAVGAAALAVATVLGAASQGLIPLDFGRAFAVAAGSDRSTEATEAASASPAAKAAGAAETPRSSAAIGTTGPQQSTGTQAPQTGQLETSPAANSDQPAAPTQNDAGTPAAEPSPWTAWAIAPPKLAFAGQSLLLRLECDSLPDGSLHDLNLSGLKVRRIELTATRTEIEFDVTPLPAGHYDGRASWSFTLTDETGRPSQQIEGSCQILPPAR